jgi:hypothetical protein
LPLSSYWGLRLSSILDAAAYIVFAYCWNCELIEFCDITTSIGSCLGLFYSRVPTENVVRGMIFSQKRMLENHMTADRDRFLSLWPKARVVKPRPEGVASPKAEIFWGSSTETKLSQCVTERPEGMA